MIPVCRHIKPNGARCQSPALADAPYCYHHDRLHRALATRRSGKKNKLVLHPLENRVSVFMALSDVLRSFAACQIDECKAARLIQGLRIAGQLAPSTSEWVAEDAVEYLDFTQSGEELAPKLTFCTSDDRCDNCPRRDDCDLERSRDWRAGQASGVADDRGGAPQASAQAA